MSKERALAKRPRGTVVIPGTAEELFTELIGQPGWSESVGRNLVWGEGEVVVERRGHGFLVWTVGSHEAWTFEAPAVRIDVEPDRRGVRLRIRRVLRRETRSLLLQSVAATAITLPAIIFSVLQGAANGFPGWVVPGLVTFLALLWSGLWWSVKRGQQRTDAAWSGVARLVMPRALPESDEPPGPYRE